MSRHEEDTAEFDMATLEERAARFFGPRVQAVQVDFGAVSHPGLVRRNNEDHYAIVRRRRSREVLATNLPDAFEPIHDDAYVMVVADGIGGAAFGEVASRIALQTGWELTAGAYKWHFNINEAESNELRDMLHVYAQLMHRKLKDRAGADRHLTGMGTTITGALTAGKHAFVGHVGDSRAYLFRNGALQRLTRDHSMAQKMVDIGEFDSVDEAPRYMKNMLLNSLGQSSEAVQVDTAQLQLADGDCLLLCSDGLSDMVADPDMAAILAQRMPSQQAAETLLSAALEQGGRDNITVLLARYAIAAETAQER